MSDNLNTSNSNPNWKSYTETHDTDDIILATDFNNEFSIKVDQEGGYSLNQNLVSCSIDQNSTIRNSTTTITIQDLINFYSNYSVVEANWTPIFKVNSSLTTNTSYSASGTYKTFNGITYYWGEISVSDIGILNGIITNGNMNFTQTYSTTDVAQDNIVSTGGTGTGATFNVSSKQVYKASKITMTTNGKNYKVNDVLTIGNGGTANITAVTLDGEINSISTNLTNTPVPTQPSNTNTTLTGGSGTGATFLYSSRSQLLYVPSTVEIKNAGTGYKVNDSISIINVGTITITAIDTNGGITTFTNSLITVPQTNNMAGTSVSGTGGSGTGATFTITSSSATYYYLTNVVLNEQGSGYKDLDVITLNMDTTKLADITVSSVSDLGNISALNYTLNQNYLSTDMAGNNINGTGGSGTGALFSIVSTQYFTYNQVSIVNGGQNYTIGDLLSLKQAGSYTVSQISSANGTMEITNFPNAQNDDLQVMTNVDFFDGYNSGNLYMCYKNGISSFYKDQKNTNLNTNEVNPSFTLKFSGYYKS